MWDITGVKGGTQLEENTMVGGVLFYHSSTTV